MKTKKSKIELAREIIANLRRGMGKPPLDLTERQSRASAAHRSRTGMQRPNQLQTSHT